MISNNYAYTRVKTRKRKKKDAESKLQDIRKHLRQSMQIVRRLRTVAEATSSSAENNSQQEEAEVEPLRRKQTRSRRWIVD